MATKAERPLLPLKDNTAGLSPDQILELYRLMYLSRHLDDREILLKRQQRIFFQISGAGHEAVNVAAGDLLRPGYDWFYPYYRDRALALRLGVSPEQMLFQAVGAAADRASGGRQMPSHWADPGLHIVAGSSPTGTQFLQAVGCAAATRYLRHQPEVLDWARDHHPPVMPRFQPDEIVFVSGGEGSTSEGEFWEAVNSASREKLPLLFVIEDNGYAISVPCEVQTPGGSISRLLTTFPDLRVAECDGCDLFDSYAALADAVAYVRSGAGPALVHAHVTRPYSHSLSDDERLYKPDEERESEAHRDPLRRLRAWLLHARVATQQQIKATENDVEQEILSATDKAIAAAPPSAESVTRHVYSEAVDPTSAAFATEPAAATGAPKTMVELINACLHDEMERDPRIVVFGEDVADCSREEYLDRVKGKGGVFKVTAGLQRKFGSARCYNSPLAEASIVGRALGMSTRGLKPVCEIQFFDYIWPAMMQLRDEVSSFRWRSNGGFGAPFVLRVPIGGYLTGGAIYHSQSGESIFTHMPGLRVIMPSTAVDANGLLRTAIRCDDPVLFLEHKRLYREPFNRGPYPGPDYCVPFGKARVVTPGSDLSVITYGAVVQRALQAAQKAQRDLGASVEIIDLRSLNPYDWPAIVASVQKTARVVVAHEDMLSWGFGAEIAARIADELFESLDAPVRRVAARDVYVGYHPNLEDHTLPQTEDLFRAMSEILRY